MVAMAGMLFTGDKTFMGFGVATMIVVAVAVLGSLTVLPATLAALGDKVDRVRVPFLHRRAAPMAAAGSGARSSTASSAARSSRPSLAGGLLLALAAPALQLHIAAPGFDTLPQNLSSVQDLQQAAEGVPRRRELRQVMVKTDDARGAAVTTAIAALERQRSPQGSSRPRPNVD